MSTDSGVVASIVIPVRNGMPYLEEAIDSALSTGVEGVEVVVRENASTDGSREWLAARAPGRFRLLDEPERCSAGENWTAAAEAARGRYIKLLCSDDYLLPGGFARQLAAARANPDATLIASRRRIISDQGRTVLRARGLRGYRGRQDGARAAARAAYSGTNPFGEPSSVLFRADALRASLPFDDERPYLIDLDMYVRVLRLGDAVGLDSVDAVFRLSTGSWSSKIGARQLEQYRSWARLATERGDVVPSGWQRRLAEPRFRSAFLARRAVNSVTRLVGR